MLWFEILCHALSDSPSPSQIILLKHVGIRCKSIGIQWFSDHFPITFRSPRGFLCQFIRCCGSPVSSISWHDRLWGSQHSPSPVGCLCKKKHTISLIFHYMYHKNSKLYKALCDVWSSLWSHCNIILRSGIMFAAHPLHFDAINWGNDIVYGLVVIRSSKPSLCDVNILHDICSIPVLSIQ